MDQPAPSDQTQNPVSNSTTPQPRKITSQAIMFGAIIPLILLVVVGLLVYNQLQLKSQVDNLTSQLQQQSEENSQLKGDNAALTSQIDQVKNPPYFTNYLPVKYLNTDYQKAAQVFQLTSSQNVSGIRLQSSYGTGNLTLSLYEVSPGSPQIESSTLLTQKQFPGTLVVKEKQFDVLFNSPLVLEAGRSYALVLEADDQKSEIDISFTEADTNDAGEMYIFSRTIGGNGEILDPNFSWQPRHDQDLVYELLGLPDSE